MHISCTSVLCMLCVLNDVYVFIQNINNRIFLTCLTYLHYTASCASTGKFVVQENCFLLDLIEDLVSNFFHFVVVAVVVVLMVETVAMTGQMVADVQVEAVFVSVQEVASRSFCCYLKS